MSEPTRAASVTLKLCICAHCGVPFGIPAELFDHLVAARSVVACPNGHVRPMGVEPPHERRLRELERLVAEQQVQLVREQAETKQLRRAMVDRLVGPETAPDAAP